MVFRCKPCQESIWVQSGRSQSSSVICKGCHQEYSLTGWAKLKKSEKKVAEDARRLAMESGIDLPGAYSILLHVMTLDEVKQIGTRGATACRVTPEPPGDAPTVDVAAVLNEANDVKGHEDSEESRKHRYDPAFQKSVEAGLLSSRQAVERGRRDAYAAMISGRHGLPMAAAYAVADNRVSVLEALRRQRTFVTEEPVELAIPTARPRQLAPALVALLVLVAVVVVVIDRMASTRIIESPVVNEQLHGITKVRRDGRGRIVQVLGPDPRAVLFTYCSESDRVDYEALTVVPSALPGTRARVGLLRPGAGEDLLAITISEDREAGLWIAGNGRRPLIADDAPRNASKAITAR